MKILRYSTWNAQYAGTACALFGTLVEVEYNTC